MYYLENFNNKSYKQNIFFSAMIILLFINQNIKIRVGILFFAAILNFITNIVNFGVMAFFLTSLSLFFKIVTSKEALNAFSLPLIWQIIFFFILSRALIKSGLSKRIALHIVYYFGKSTLSLSYGIIIITIFFTFIPTSTIRIGGIIIPILDSIFEILDKNDNKFKNNLIFSVLYSNTIASILFISASSGNLYIQSILKDKNIIFTGYMWTKYAIMPCLICFLILPFLIQFFTTKKNKNIETLQIKFKEEIQNLPKFSLNESIVMLTFIFLISIWCFNLFGLDPICVLFFVIPILENFQIINWKEDIINNQEIWKMFLWLPNILMLSSLINKHQIFDPIINIFLNILHIFPYNFHFILILIIYGYSQYFFASTTIHIISCFEIMLHVMLQYNFPLLLSALSLSYISNLFAGLTSYSSTEGILLTKKYELDNYKFLKSGFLITTIIFTIFLSSGILWWQILGVNII